MSEEKRLYFKIGNHVVSALKSDCEKQVIDCSKVEVLVWTREEPYYKFEHNDLAQHVAETEDIYRFEGFETPEGLIDQEILQVLKEKAMTYKNFKNNYEHNKEFREYFDKAINYIKGNKPDTLQDFLNIVTSEDVVFAMTNNTSPEEFVNCVLF